jgi:hypothetical protein
MFGVALLLAAAGLSWWLWARAQERARKIAACTHRYEYVSVWNEGELWTRMCRYCPFQEPVRDEDVLQRLRRDFRGP